MAFKVVENGMLESLKRISGRILLARNAFCLWKAMMGSIHIPESSESDAQRSVNIMNGYNPVFQTILSATEETFIIELRTLGSGPPIIPESLHNKFASSLRSP